MSLEKELGKRCPNGHKRFREMALEEMELHSQKNHDYAKGGDPLGNFYRVADIFQQYPNLSPADPRVVAIIYMMKQLDCTLWFMNEGFEGQVEGFDDRMRDVGVYAKLIRIIHEELG